MEICLSFHRAKLSRIYTLSLTTTNGRDRSGYRLIGGSVVKLQCGSGKLFTLALQCASLREGDGSVPLSACSKHVLDEDGRKPNPTHTFAHSFRLAVTYDTLATYVLQMMNVTPEEDESSAMGWIRFEPIVPEKGLQSEESGGVSE
jgi:hypothetical protein